MVKASYFLWFLTFLTFRNSYAVEKQPSVFLPYGFLKFNSVSSSRALISGGNTNLVNPTMVQPDLSFADMTSREPRNTFQVGQTRIGTWIQSSQTDLKGQLEFDFLDLKKSSPSLASVPRLRIAKIIYQLEKEQEILLGQDWEPFSPFRPFSNGLIGIMFHTGNIGFMRQQAKWTLSKGDYILSFAAILPGVNNSANDNEVELGFSPGFNQQSTWKLNKLTKIGFSLMTSLPKMNQVSENFFGINVFWNHKLENIAEIRALTYYGKDLYTIGALGLSTEGTHEMGGYISFLIDSSEKMVYSGGFGIAHILEEAGSKWPSLVGFQVKNNMKIDISVAYRLTPEFKLFSEYVYLFSQFNRNSESNQISVGAHGLELGGRYDF